WRGGAWLGAFLYREICQPAGPYCPRGSRGRPSRGCGTRESVAGSGLEHAQFSARIEGSLRSGEPGCRARVRNGCLPRSRPNGVVSTILYVSDVAPLEGGGRVVRARILPVPNQLAIYLLPSHPTLPPERPEAGRHPCVAAVRRSGARNLAKRAASARSALADDGRGGAGPRRPAR